MEGVGHDNHVLVHLHRVIDNWEAEVLAQQLVDHNAKGNINHYWKVKNILAHVLLQQQGNWDRTRELINTMWQGLDQARASLILLSEELVMDMAIQGTLLEGKPSQQTPSICCGDICAPSQSILEPTDLRDKWRFPFQDETKDNMDSDDPVQLYMKQTCWKETKSRPSQLKQSSFPPKQSDAEFTSVDFDGCLVVEESLNAHASKK